MFVKSFQKVFIFHAAKRYVGFSVLYADIGSIRQGIINRRFPIQILPVKVDTGDPPVAAGRVVVDPTIGIDAAAVQRAFIPIIFYPDSALHHRDRIQDVEKLPDRSETVGGLNALQPGEGCRLEWGR